MRDLSISSPTPVTRPGLPSQQLLTRLQFDDEIFYGESLVPEHWRYILHIHRGPCGAARDTPSLTAICKICRRVLLHLSLRQIIILTLALVCANRRYILYIAVRLGMQLFRSFSWKGFASYFVFKNTLMISRYVTNLEARLLQYQRFAGILLSYLSW